MTKLPPGYKIVDSGDPEAPWELVGPGGRTVSISATKKDLREIAVSDVGEQSYMNQAQAMQEASGHVTPSPKPGAPNTTWGVKDYIPDGGVQEETVPVKTVLMKGIYPNIKRPGSGRNRGFQKSPMATIKPRTEVYVRAVRYTDPKGKQTTYYQVSRSADFNFPENIQAKDAQAMLRDVPRPAPTEGGPSTKSPQWSGVTGVPQKRADLEALPDDRIVELWRISGTVLSKAQRTRVISELGRRRLDPETGLRRGAPSPPKSDTGRVVKASGRFEMRQYLDGRYAVVDSINGEVMASTTSTGSAGGKMRSEVKAEERLAAWHFQELLPGGYRSTPQSPKSPSSAVPPSQDQRKAAERRADASGPTIRPTAASSGKQAADPSIAKHSKTKSQDAAQRVREAERLGMEEYPPGSGRLTFKNQPSEPKPKSPQFKRGPVTPKTAPKSPRQLSNDPKQVARRAKRGFPNGH